MKPAILIIALTLILSSCNNLNDLRPIDPGTEIPQAAVKVVKDKFPKAEDLVFKPVLKDKIWEVKLKSDADRYTSLVDFGKMWETFKVAPDGVPTALEGLMNKTAFGGGTLSAYSTAYYATTANNKLIYNFKGENYSFAWSGIFPNVNGSATFDPALYRITTYDISDLPASVKDTIQSARSMTFVMGYTWVRLDDTKLYYVFADQKNDYRTDRVSMLFDDKGKLRWSSLFFNTQPGLPNTSSNIETVPAEIKQYFDSLPELSGYEYKVKLVNNVDGLTSYYFILAMGQVSQCEFFFDKDFNVLNKRYTVILY